MAIWMSPLAKTLRTGVNMPHGMKWNASWERMRLASEVQEGMQVDVLPARIDSTRNRMPKR